MKAQKKLLVRLLAYLFSCLFIFNSCENSTTETGVVINGVTWATRNVSYAGTFAQKAEDAGMFYQWNRNAAWETTGEVSNWNAEIPAGTIWKRENDPSPAGWRVPTHAEIQTLLDTTKVLCTSSVQNGVKGNVFTDKSSGNSLFLPFSGYRYFTNGTLYYQGTLGMYWINTEEKAEGSLALYSNIAGNNLNGSRRTFAYSIRSVKE